MDRNVEIIHDENGNSIVLINDVRFATQKLPLLINNAINKRWSANYKEKHKLDAKYGWYRYTTRFALPMFNNEGKIIKCNIFRIEMLVRHASDNKRYLYDMVNVKKEKETKYPT